MRTDSASATRRLGLMIWLAGLPGLALVVQLLPTLLAGRPAPLAMPALTAIAFAQGALMLALAAAAGAAWAGRLGLRAPLFEALAGGPRPSRDAWRRLLLAGLAGALAGGLLLLALTALSPQSLRGIAPAPLAARLLYGGISEEILMRWGLLTLLLWLPWRLLQRGQGAPRPAWVWLAIAASALAFAAGHLPAAKALAGGLDAGLIAYVLAGNTAFGLLAGWLFWRHGLEAAMFCHLGSHLLAALLPL